MYRGPVTQVASEVDVQSMNSTTPKLKPRSTALVVQLGMREGEGEAEEE